MPRPGAVPTNRLRLPWLLFPLFLALPVFEALGADFPDTACKPGNQVLFYSPHPRLEARTTPGFPADLFNQLREPLQDIGYCLQPVPDSTALQDSARHGDNLLMHLFMAENGRIAPINPDSQGASDIIVTLLRVEDWNRGKLQEANSRPLAVIRVQDQDWAGLANVAAKKIVENLRSQYVAHLLLQTRPAGVQVQTSLGLEGKTPLEWILPVGTLSIRARKIGYLPLERNLDLSRPGLHTYELQLTKKRFYHSKFIYPALGFGAVALASYALEMHYYRKYLDLGPEDYHTRPQVFGQTFGLAKNYERVSLASLALATLSLGLSFRF